MTKVIIHNNVRCQIIPRRASTLKTIRDNTRIKNPNAYHIKMKVASLQKWDGYEYYINKEGYFDIGLLPLVIKALKERKLDYELIDDREYTDIDFEDLTGIELDGKTPFDHQYSCIRAITQNKLDNTQFPIGIIDAATNAGKTLMVAMLHLSVKDNKTVVLCNSADLYEDMIKALNSMLGEDKVGYCRGKKLKWGDIMVAMIPTLASKNSEMALNILRSYFTLILDECDTGSSKSSMKVIKSIGGAFIRVGLSGSVNKNKNPLINRKIECLFGQPVIKISNRELVDKGVSCEVKVTILKGNTLDLREVEYAEAYKEAIIFNPDRNKTIIRRVKWHLKKGRDKILILARYHEHVEFIYRCIQANVDTAYDVKMVHHETPERKQIQDDFENGKIDILVGSYILKRGKNFPLMTACIHIGGGDSASDVIQILGRAVRRHETKNLTYLDDFQDEGHYFKKHSKTRIKEYVAQKMEVSISK